MRELRRYFTEDTVDPIAVVAGLVQTALFSDFFYIYFTKCVSPSLSFVRPLSRLMFAESCGVRSSSYQFV